MAPHPSTLVWKIPWTEEPRRLQSMGSLRVRHDRVSSLSLFTFMHCRRRNGNPLQCSCLENPRDGEPGGLLSMGLHRVRHDWSDLAAAAAVAQMVKNPPAMQETWVQPLGWEDPLEEGMTTHSSILPGESQGQGSLVGYSLRCHKELDMTEWLGAAHTRTFLGTPGYVVFLCIIYIGQ